MAVTEQASHREMRELARRIHQRWLEYRRRNPGMSIPIDDTLSRILEHDPEYRPARPRTAKSQRPPLRNPGVFTIQQIAKALGTTVGDLLGERGYIALRDVLSHAERRHLRDTVRLLRDLFDLDDKALAFAGDGGDLVLLDSRSIPARVTDDAMAPELAAGSTILIETARTAPQEGDLVAVYVEGEGALLGRWSNPDGGSPSVVRTNPAYAPLSLADRRWSILGTVSR